VPSGGDDCDNLCNWIGGVPDHTCGSAKGLLVETLDRWSDFFVATAGAAAALAGLIIVAMTVNIKTILDIPSMTSRAAATIASLILIVVSASAALIPGQSPSILGVEILLFALGSMALVIDSAIKMLRAAARQYRALTVIKIVVAVLQVLPFGIGAALLLTGADQGIYWVAAGMIMVFMGSVANAWVLLVEILR
jgi:hypothetical protein